MFALVLNAISKQASLFAKKQYYDNIIKYKQCNGRLPEGNPSIELVLA